MKTASGSYILVYDGIQNSGTRILELTQFNSAAFTVSTYYAYVVAYNWVGASPNGAPVTIVIQDICSPTYSKVSGPGIGSISAAVPVQVNVQAMDQNNVLMTTYTDIFYLHIQQYCIKTLNFYCYPQTIPYQILNGQIIMTQMSSNGDGTYSAFYTVPLNGQITVSVFLMQIGGAYGEYFDNVFMDGTPILT